MFKIALALAGLVLVSGQGCPSIHFDGSRGHDSYAGTWAFGESSGEVTGYSQFEDPCVVLGYYGDGICHIGCQFVDPDCVEAGYGYAGGYDDGGSYGDSGGDFGGGDSGDGSGDGSGNDDGYGDDSGGADDGDDSGWDDGSYWDEGWSDSGSDYDWCAEAGYYGDGVCDSGCPCSDPDCWE